MPSKVSPLSGGLIARKGDAAPSSPTTPRLKAVEPARTERLPVQESRSRTKPKGKARSPSKKKIPKGTEGTIAVTVRLDQKRYRKLKLRGVDHRMSNQEILVEALDAYLA